MADVVAAARALAGARFRLHGRDPAGGLDCVGVIACALGETGVPSGYALRGGDPRTIAAMLDARLRRVGSAAPGDVLLFDVGAGQLHLGIATGTGVVHADAALRRVVERPGAPGWPVIGIWRQGE